tara:strand:+ start:4243 stop:7275 length:3033 start_codon:yes stop_codon:yes gene_type:complete
MNRLGTPFVPWVTKQINTRQSSLGKSIDLPVQDLLYQNAKSPWLRLSSTVDIEKLPESDGAHQALLDLGFNGNQIEGSNIAKNFILQGGTTFLDGDTGSPNVGLNASNQSFRGAYGWGGLDQRGYAPMPGLTGATVQYQGNGALSKTTIKMKCYTRNQLALMDMLYMRPGYNLLLEFGWSQYLNNDGVLVTYDNFYSDALSFLFNPQAISSEKPNHFDVLDLIQKERRNRDGNYEGVFGKVVNFDWSFNPDGSYDCSTVISGMGDMMESLKVNIKLDTQKDDEQNTTAPTVAGETELPPLIANKTKTTLNKILFNLYEKVNSPSDKDQYWDVKLPSFPNAPVEITAEGEQSTAFKKEDINIKDGMLSLQNITTDLATNASPQVYITFGTLLAFIQQKILIFNKDGAPLFAFDVDFNDLPNDKNYIVKIPGQFSSDPLVCLVPYSGLPKDVANDAIIYKTSINETLKQKASNYNFSEYLGKLCNIYLNINNIATILDTSPRQEDNSLSVLSFLNNVVSSFTKALGGINMISIKVDEQTQKIKFIEGAPQRFEQVPPLSTYARINTFGVKPNTEGSFVRNINMVGAIGSNFMSAIAIGAQYSGNKISSNSTGLSVYNRGLKDRVIPQRNNSTYTAASTDESDKEETKTISDCWNKQINRAGESGKSLFYSIYQDRLLILEDINALKELNTTFMSMVSGKLVLMKQLQSPTFLPFNLSFDIDGISGMRMFERFLIDDRVLPPSYGEGNVNLLVKSLNHMISPSSWITQIDTQAVPSRPLDPVAKPVQLDSISTTQSTSVVGNDSPPPPGEQPSEDELLRIRLTRILDDGTQTLGYMEILDTDETTVLYTLATSELPWKGNRNKVSSIPTDKYRVKSHVSGKHGQCFWLIGNEQGGYAKNRLFGNGYTRTAVLIHKFPKAPGWALGCIGPGLRFNDQANQRGRQKGTGQNYLEPALPQSNQAMAKIIGTLYSEGSFKMEIVNQGGVSSNQLPKSFDTVRGIATSKNLLPNPYNK